MTINRVSLAEAVRALGRAMVFAGDAFTAGGLTALGATEGEVTAEEQETYNDLTLPDDTREAIHERDVMHGSALVTVPLILGPRTDDSDDGSAVYDVIASVGDGSGGGYSTPQPIVPTDLLLLGDHVHYIDVDPEPDAWGTIHRVSKSGGAVELVVSGQMNPSDLAGDDGSIYWTNEGRVDDGADDGRVVGAAADGSDLQTVSAGEARPHLLVVTNDEVVWVNRNGGDAMVLTDGI
ncbi:MAG: hypothetical protein ACOCUS_05825 [Polyangiales bacterium]